jgi:ceramide glucosyltransferase
MVMLSAVLEPVRYGLGATIAIKREVLQKIGGFRALRDHLADDYYLGSMVAEHGYDVKLSSSIVTMMTEETRFVQFWHHQLRWARTYRTSRPLSLATIMLHGPFWALLFVVASSFSKIALGAFALVLVARILMASMLIGKLLGLHELRRDAWLVPLKDLIMTGVWFASLFSKEVLWGSRRLKIRDDGTIQEVHG